MSIYRTSDMPKWNNFLSEQLLIESRLKAAIKKFPEIDEEIIKQLSNSDPSGKNAYLMWMAQAMKDSGAGIYTVPGLASEKLLKLFRLLLLSMTKQRISQLNKQRKKDGKSLYPTILINLVPLKTLKTSWIILVLLGLKEKRKEKEEALGGATVLQDDDHSLLDLRLQKMYVARFRLAHILAATSVYNYFENYTCVLFILFLTSIKIVSYETGSPSTSL